MSQQYDHSLPPPPPSPRSGGTSTRAGPVSGSLAPLADAGSVPENLHVQRSRPVSAVLPSLPTAFLGPQGAHSFQASTPVSGSRLSPGIFPYAPGRPGCLGVETPGRLALPLPPATPRSPGMEPYNPRQWTRGQVSGSHMVLQQRHSTMPASTAQFTGQEAAMPSPPPPYSPATPDNIARAVAVTASPMLDTNGFTALPLEESSSRTSPQIPMSPAFPPPPAQSSRYRERSASGLGGNKSFFSLSGLRGKQPANVEPYVPQAGTSVYMPSWEDVRPPAAKRAASTGHIQSGSSIATSSTAVLIRALPESNWRPGMPLPGPPPGPPPPGARSQSLNRPLGVVASSSAKPNGGSEASHQRRTLAGMMSSLGPVPPTPANWIDSDTPAPKHTQSVPQDDVLSTGSTLQTQAASPPLRTYTGASRDNSLARWPARRETSTQGLRERRSQSRAAQGTADEDPRRLSNLVIAPPEGGSISRRRVNTGNVSGHLEPSSAPSPLSKETQQEAKVPGNVFTPPYTPAAGKQALHSGKQIKMPGSASSDRPISHLLHTPNDTTEVIPAPLSPARPQSSASTKKPTKLDVFAMQAIERHRIFVEKESAAANDEERLELFANFMVLESRLRRDKYTSAYNAMAGDIVDLTRDMWRSYSGNASKRSVTPNTAMSSADPTVSSWASDGQPTSAHTNMPSSASSMGEFTPATDTGSIGDLGFERTETRQWADSFKPSLSPIPSMAVSTVPDEDSSRGRTASRWWEGSNSQDDSIGRPDRIEKTRRETKYMGINPATLHALTPEPARHRPTSDANVAAYDYSPDEYPPEKVGWHEEADYDTPMVTPNRYGDRKDSTPGVAPLNVSRLVTLPPPYPRHHPAVNNSHPLLSDLRNEHRLLADPADIQKIKDAYMDQDFALTGQQKEAEKRRRAKLRLSIQNKVSEGSISFADAARAEADFDSEETEWVKTNSRASFDVFEASVAHPLNGLLTKRLAKANACIQQLRAELESGRDSADPNRAQEEGDEHPERLEKLTLLKWLFEAREQLNKEMFDLHTMRSEKYSEVILTPFRISKDAKKMEEAMIFFKKDSVERQVSYAKESHKRFEELQSIMEKHVSQGVEDQLSAFWDIAPGLLEVLQQIHPEMKYLNVQIPLQEYEENPSYHQHPLQYLYSLLNHAEKSAYQFIESQTNLLCLLHEVRTATTKCQLRLAEIERNATSGNEQEIRAEMKQARREAEDILTEDLKEKVGEVDRQWQEALGYGLAEAKERVSVWLEESGGFEEGFDA
ncbi:hypothetical protein DOTSEDRAFT_71149 [Dothistroma septosporum NZE10]|uniref:Uncharacterized protein n=1 Tax=Dothistroma septosporum (strain NZE10 / CBS 128990) TaxID=675120 RepID=N1PPL4_DOTSN|nr:hypothetical protein DOTSEDRAFT_71149 [Dothistroma septosporum NZE10]